VRTSSPRQSPDRPIASVRLQISLQADEKTASRIKELFPNASLKGDVCEVRIAGGGPSEVAERLKELLETARAETRSPKAFK
jgi:hypothetical protein